MLSLVKLKTSSDENRSSTTESMAENRTVKFADETRREGFGKSVKATYDDIKFYSDFISYTIQCLFVAEKWESMVDLADTSSNQILTIFPDPDNEILFLLSYLLQYRIYGEDKLYTEANQRTVQ